MIQRTVVFWGRVQGVGFRQRCKRLVGERPVMGWVKNNPDGSVTLALEGEPQSISDTLSAIQLAMEGNLTEVDVGPPQPPSGIEGFTIR